MWIYIFSFQLNEYIGMCNSYFSHCSDKMPKKAIQGRKGLFWFIVREWGKDYKPQSGNRERWMLVFSALFLLYLIQGSGPWIGATHIQGGDSILSYTSPETPSETFPEVYLLGGSRVYQVDNQC